ncbi:MAG: HAMP domain-containing histidine kinase [Gammaproteobacteria bacterium]|nr:HAMP domain-containing histidine kinase [Gammaproteobacteria bacterium]MBU1555020.1 HAMP domain-containing histidine kinase [Gammaproteobacteria bacterium]MBU2071011.1 HAMP domain-containing histidine kinase [Gammaproteobacteria bacterium]MBU2184279.1 HAMP domain-containing histidine kinase [Gammaproteobacteria bacterium]MBU2206464.1 HAMP domain-containing histidine kinase [Gammaproteobacteria bacterium]
MARQLIIATELSEQHQLKHFIQFRWGLIGFEALALIAGWLLHYTVSSWPLLGLLLLTHICTNLLPYWLAASKMPLKVIYLLCCTLDILLLTCLLALSGGVSNGLVAMLLLPVAVAAVMLPGRSGYIVAVLAILGYSLLLQVGDLHIPDIDTLLAQTAQQASHDDHAGHDMHAQHSSGGFGQHMQQMWWAFTISALLISWFISAQAKLNRIKSKKISELQQQQIRNEQMLALATFAANAAHDLASPLQTMQLLADELAATEPAAQELKQQLQRCQQIVQQLRSDAGSLREENNTAPLCQQTEQAVARWLNSRPEISLNIERLVQAEDFSLADSQGFTAALLNILDNAADASLANNSSQLQLQLSLQAEGLTLQVRDFGEGLSDSRLAELGKLPQQSEHGLGIGQFLANMSIERLGGTVRRQNAGNGTLTLISMPRQHSEPRL